VAFAVERGELAADDFGGAGQPVGQEILQRQHVMCGNVSLAVHHHVHDRCECNHADIGAKRASINRHAKIRS